LATAVYLSLTLQRPLLLEGEPGVGKTELAKALAKVLQRPLVRLQCYDGMEQREALYEWNHAAQLMHMRAQQDHATPEQLEHAIYQEKYLLRRPMLQALQTPAPGAVLLIDDIIIYRFRNSRPCGSLHSLLQQQMACTRNGRQRIKQELNSRSVPE
jgi:MoxR-like ATPase